MFNSKVLMFLLASIFIVISCGGDDNNENPDPNNNTGGRLLWKYKLNDTTNLFSDVPALDEDGNLYFATNEKVDYGKTGKFTVVSLDKDGKKRWEKVIENTTGYTKVSYRDNKVFFLVGNYLSFSSLDPNSDPVPFATTYALSSSDGSEIWSKEEVNWIATWPKFAVSDKKVYVYINNTSVFPDGSESKVISYDINTGDEKGEIIVATDSGRNDGTILKAMTVMGDNIYALILKGIPQADSGTLSITQIIDNGDVLTNGWLFNYDEGIHGDNDKWNYIYSGDLPIDDDGNIYFSTSYNNEFEKRQTIISVSQIGQFNWIHKMTTEPIGSTLAKGVTIDENGNLYTSFSKNFHSVSSSGSAIWELEKSYYDETEYIDLDYLNQPSIGENGSTYHHNLYGFVSVKNDGKMDWKYSANVENIEFADYLTIAPNGNIIIMGSEHVVCYKGDSTTLAKKAWAKIYGDAGNTNSK